VCKNVFGVPGDAPQRDSHSQNGGSTRGGYIPDRPNGGPTRSGHPEDGRFREGEPSGTAIGGTPQGGSIQGGTSRGVVFRCDESVSGGSIGQPSGGDIHVCHTTRLEMHAPMNSDHRYSSIIDSGEAMRNHVLERTIRRLEKQVETLTTDNADSWLTVVMEQQVCTICTYGVVFFTGGEESREFGVDPTSHSQVFDRSAGTGVAVREPVGAGSTCAGVGPVVTMLTLDLPTSENRDQCGDLVAMP